MSDLIKRSDAIEALYKYSFVSKDVIEREIKAIPTADRPRGHWREIYGSSMGIYQCSECGNLIHSPYDDIRKKFHAWCGRCGADMRGADDE